MDRKRAPAQQATKAAATTECRTGGNNVDAVVAAATAAVVVATAAFTCRPRNAAVVASGVDELREVRFFRGPLMFFLFIF